MTVELIESKETWDKFVDESPYGLIYHKWDFLKLTEKYTGFSLLPYGVFHGSILIGLFPLFYRNMGTFRSVFSPPPKSGIPYLGFLMGSEYDSLKQDKKETYLNQVVDEVSCAIESLAPHYISISSGPNFLDIRPFIWNGYTVTPHFTYVIDLNRELEEIWKGFKKNLRKQLSTCEPLDLRLIQSADPSLLFELLYGRYDEQGLTVPLHGLDYLTEIIDTFPDSLKVYYLYYEDQPIGGILTHEYKRFILWMGNTRIMDDIFGNEYINWILIQKAKNDGYGILEIQGAGTKNLCQFKSKFNPNLEICYTIEKKHGLGVLAEWVYRNFIKKRVI